MKVLIVLALLAIVIALGSAGLFMLRGGRTDESASTGEASRDKRMARALALRVGISIALFLLILLAYALGWIQPSGLPLR
jgi:hypothetical protein